MRAVLELAALVLLLASVAHAGDGATIIFRSGHVIFIDNGFKSLSEAMKALNGESRDHRIVEFSTGEGNYLLNAAEIVGICRDRCRLEVRDLRDPARAVP